MTDLNGGPNVRGGVVLGGRQRTVTLSRDDDGRLTILAKMHNTSPHTFLEYVIAEGLNISWNGMLAGKMFYVLATQMVGWR